MVVFTCQKCNDSLRKKAVENHGCRPFLLTCIDCVKDFRGNEYVGHTSCLTEGQRYGGKDYVAKEVNKKQKSWFDHVVKSGPKAKDPHVKQLLAQLTLSSNVPRQRKKFHNFVKSSCPARYNYTLTDQTFDYLESEFKKLTLSPEKSSSDKAAPDQVPETEENDENENVNGKEEKKKKKKKDKLKSSMDESQEVQSTCENGAEMNGKEKKKKKKKDKLKSSMDESQEVQSTCENGAEMGGKEKKKKKKEKNGVSSLEDTPVIEDPGVAAEENGEWKSVESKKKKKKNMEQKVVSDVKTGLDNWNKEWNIQKKPSATEPDEYEEPSKRGKKSKKRKFVEMGPSYGTVEENELTTAQVEDPTEPEPIQPVQTDKPDQTTHTEEPLTKKQKRKKEKLEKYKAELAEIEKQTKPEEPVREPSPEKPPEPMKPQKFKWSQVIVGLLESAPDHEVSLKRLTKKVLTEYTALCGRSDPDQFNLKLNKKLKGTQGVFVVKDKVRLVKMDE